MEEIKDSEILNLSTSIAKSFCSTVSSNRFPLDELINEGFVAAKEALISNADNPSYRYALSERIKYSIIDFINSNNHLSLPSNTEGEIEDVEDLSYREEHSSLLAEDVIKIIKTCSFYDEKREDFPSLKGHGLEILFDRFVYSMSYKELSKKYGASQIWIQMNVTEMIGQLRIATRKFLEFKNNVK